MDGGKWEGRGVAGKKDTPEVAVATAQVRGVRVLSYNSDTSGEKTEEMSKKCFSIKVNWAL